MLLNIATVKKSHRWTMHSNHFDDSHTSLLTMLCWYFANFCAYQGREASVSTHAFVTVEWKPSFNEECSSPLSWVWWWCNTSEEQPSIIAFADKSELRRKNHNELAVLKQPLNVPPIICGHLVVTMLCPSNYVWFSNGMPNGTSEGNQYLGSSSRSVGDILYPELLQCAGSWPYHVMTFSLPRRQPFDTESGLCPEK